MWRCILFWCISMKISSINNCCDIDRLYPCFWGMINLMTKPKPKPKPKKQTKPNQRHKIITMNYIHGNQCSRLKSSMPFKHNLAIQNIPLSKQPFNTQPQIKNEDITWSPQYYLPIKHCLYDNCLVKFHSSLENIDLRVKSPSLCFLATTSALNL